MSYNLARLFGTSDEFMAKTYAYLQVLVKQSVNFQINKLNNTNKFVVGILRTRS